MNIKKVRVLIDNEETRTDVFLGDSIRCDSLFFEECFLSNEITTLYSYQERNKAWDYLVSKLKGTDYIVRTINGKNNYYEVLNHSISFEIKLIDNRIYYIGRKKYKLPKDASIFDQQILR